MASVIQIKQVHYPESDGKPMGETDEHRDEMVRHIEVLRRYYLGQQVYVSGNILMYYEQGKRRKFVVPDALVAKGIDPGKRRIYKIWVERKVPDVVIETTSRKTRKNDTTEKPKLYARLGVKEYFLFDPDQEYLEPPLQGYRLRGNRFAAIKPADDGTLESVELGLRLRMESGLVQFYRLETGERLLTGSEAAEESQRREAEAKRREADAKQREADAKQREADAKRREAEAKRREAEAKQREAEAKQREAEASGALQAAEVELARLRELLERQTRG